MTIAPSTAVDAPTTTALEVRELRVSYRPAHRLIEVVHGVTLSVSRGRTLALVGQSGSGKSTIALAAAGLLPRRGEVTGGSITLASRDVTRFRDRDWRPLRGSEIGFVPQDPLSSLDPLQTIGSRLNAELKRHGVPRRERAVRAAELLARVGIADAAHKLDLRPHELSGGQLQRVLIAIAISGSPQLLIADEPTSALDVTVQRTILDLIGELREELGLAVLLITHDLALARERADDIAVLHDGVVVDQGPADRVVSHPEDDYTRELFANAPALSPDRYAHLLRPVDPAVDAAIEVAGIVKTFPGSPRPALNGVDLRVHRGSVHALVGESGSGKSTLARIVAGLESFDEGAVTVSGRALPQHPPVANRFARRLQMVYQNPLSALDPRFTVRQLLDEPISLSAKLTPAERAARVATALDHVALPSTVLDSRPHDLSGGQRQRVAVARALALSPEVLVLDEPTSALDVTVQTQIIDLLMELRDRDELTYLFISHDLSLVRQIAEQVTVLEHGRLVESAPTAELFARPRDAYTRRLIDAIPKAT
ncbi:ABC transporter ATP-binding protein [Microbacterium nanhaiense]|uniref:ABC transporter ATP-binding protein n=1 Tax=Microbacterium nanhaiense TaxID=1301026 RepID=A0ABQ2N1X4_9MICO|nr:ABC transporter ATP-binding protein [Microbacterium nanhaiense]GGO64130.1 ABC transporter ATP-binding protein [Microbacterium nanhaiense]